jgi:myo-inositol-1-phosphate synthase
MGKIRVGVIGVGNCCSSLVQGVNFYRDASPGDRVPGLMHVVLGRYHVSEVEFSCAFDVDARKVGTDLSEAIYSPPNNTLRFSNVPPLGVPVRSSPVMDGIGRYAMEVVPLTDRPPENAASVLRETGTDVLVNYLPVGSELAARFYAGQAIEAGCAFVNCMPAFIASDDKWAARFEAAGLPVIGDDVKSQVGATIVHRALAALFGARGVRLDRTYQLNFGGNTDFLNMLERDRLESKKLSKTRAVSSAAGAGGLPSPDDIHVGPSDHVPWLADRKFAHIRLEGTAFGGAPIVCELKLEVWDSPNSAGVVIDAIRCAKLALDAGVGGPLIGPSAYLMKSPPLQYEDGEARARLESFVRTFGGHR